MARELMLTSEHLREVLDYDPLTGEFSWRVSRGNFYAGSRAGTSRADGRRVIAIDGKRYQAGRLAWLYFYGMWPAWEVDHKDLDPSNNRINNLREATRSQNQANAHARKCGQLKGTYRQAGKWYSGIRVEGKTIYLGTFMSMDAAAKAYDAAAAHHFGEFAKLNFAAEP